jgi:hypothetical protein
VAVHLRGSHAQQESSATSDALNTPVEAGDIARHVSHAETSGDVLRGIRRVDLAIDNHDGYCGASPIVDWKCEDGVSGKIGRQQLAQLRPVFEHLAGGHVER